MRHFRTLLLGGLCISSLSTGAFAANFSIPSGDLATALDAYAAQTGVDLVVSEDALKGVHTGGANGQFSVDTALTQLLKGTGFVGRHKAGAIAIVPTRFESTGPRDTSIELAQATSTRIAAMDTPGALETVTVTAQKVTEDVQNVPIAVTALSSEQLQAQKIEGGPDLLKAIPNVTFSKNNFSGYNFSIRGIGTKAISVTTDPGVAVEFNSTALIRNRLFEQEYFDVERVEVLRGPQGTLHGRNATAGVINMISAKPTDQFEGSLKAEVGNYQSRRANGFINIPIISDKLDLRIAGSFTDRDGYDYNSITQHAVNGRNLWSTRATIGFNPISTLKGDLIWEHFNENDDRSRTGKQLCHRDPGVTTLGSLTNLDPSARDAMSQGCLPGSLYDAFDTPNGRAINFVLVASTPFLGELGVSPQTETNVALLSETDPYGGLQQSHDLHTIASIKDPIYRAKADVYELNFDFEFTPLLTFTSQTAYNRDNYYSTQDYNRFNTVPVFNNSDGLRSAGGDGPADAPITPGGIFCDPQIGCSNRLAGFDIDTAKSWQFSQEIRLQSAFAGPINFSAGANYTHYRTVEDYYVLFNILTAIAQSAGVAGNKSADITKCRLFNAGELLPIGEPATAGCNYIDPNPIESINGEGHNYFRSDNPYTLDSYAGFGEAYWQATPEFKITAGLRYTSDSKTATPVPSQVLLTSRPIVGAGTVDRGYPSLPDIKQHWGEFSGRLGGQWSPTTAFTDQTMVYGFYSRGYKGGGANPPGIGFDPRPLAQVLGLDMDCAGNNTFLCIAQAQPLPYSPTFKPEFVNAFEVGSKNSLLNGTLVLNGDSFFYDYKDYQVSQIKSRTAVNENFDARIWGAELESTWQPMPPLRFNLAVGFQKSALAKGSKSIDTMDRIQGHSDYTILKPFVQLPDNCVVLKSVVEQYITINRNRTIANPESDTTPDGAQLAALCPGSAFTNSVRYQDVTPDITSGSPGFPFNETVFPNQGLGFYDDVSGNELPNSPHFTVSFGAQYIQEFSNSWLATLRGDFYWQAQQWARIYQDPIDNLRAWKNVNVRLTIDKADTGLSIEFYVKNVLNGTPITDTFINSDDTALTTNVFTLDPRLVGFSVTKTF